MKNCKATENQDMHPILPIACSTILLTALSTALPQPVQADPLAPPAVPAAIQVPAGNAVFLAAHAFGTQDYICVPTAAGLAWTFFGPQASLFKHDGQQVITHFLSPNPFEEDRSRVSWQHSRDSSTVWGAASASSTDPAFVAPGAIPWLLVRNVGSQDGPTGGHKLTPTSFIQRLNTSGGSAPQSGCAQPADVGKTALVPYTADYFFYKAASRY